jgi:alpha-D-ribose 1-methylphosphonate 5-triphosphate synthase subunit PhnH
MSMVAGIPEPGFAEQVGGAQQTFRGLLDALANPARPVPVSTDVGTPESFTPAAAATVLTLCDDATALWLDQRLREIPGVESWLRFHTGAPITVEPAEADFAIISSPAALPHLVTFAQGTDEAPHTSTTVIVIDRAEASGVTYRANGPGFEHPALWTAPAFPEGFGAQWSANTSRFPRGIDLVIAGHDSVVGLPRTTKLTEVD